MSAAGCKRKVKKQAAKKKRREKCTFILAEQKLTFRKGAGNGGTFMGKLSNRHSKRDTEAADALRETANPSFPSFPKQKQEQTLFKDLRQ